MPEATETMDFLKLVSQVITRIDLQPWLWWVARLTNHLPDVPGPFNLVDVGRGAKNQILAVKWIWISTTKPQ